MNDPEYLFVKNKGGVGGSASLLLSIAVPASRRRPAAAHHAHLATTRHDRIKPR